MLCLNVTKLLIHKRLNEPCVCRLFKPKLHVRVPASVAQLDARPTGDQEVAGSTPAEEVGNILSWRLIMKYFLRSFSPFR